MSGQLVWHERYNIGVDLIDREHRKLFSILSRLFANKEEEEKSQWVCREGIKYFREHAMKHFTEEEAYMASIGYEGFEIHRRLHDDFRKKTLPALERELMRTQYSPEAIDRFLGVCAGWLIGHTLTEDRAIAGKHTSKWTDLLPEEEQVAMRHTIIRLLKDMFQLNARVVSDCYGGEKFGKGIYYRLVYGTEKGEQWESLLVFEEKLIMSTIGSILDLEAEEVNVLMMDATRYTAQQFVNSIRMHIASAELYELKEEGLLAYDRFERIFEKNNMQFSMLFDTGAGYFAYCAIAPHLRNNENIVSIKTGSTAAEVQQYLDRNKDSGKKKILAVDDSEVILAATRKMLDGDYEVATAKSGLSAIRSITLDRPDLVLLDYEMPVCDGAQILEMIRAEKEFADIPVIFLTGRMDKETVSKVVSLKPAGYILKTPKLLEVRKGIDGFFKTGRVM